MILIKPGVDLRGLSPQMALAATIIHGAYSQYRCNLVITSGGDGEHMKGSKHYTGEALDFRTHDVPHGYLEHVENAARAALGEQFDVVAHDDHLHVEFDPKGDLNG